MLPKVNSEIDRLIKEGISIPVESSECATPVVILRLCGNYKVTVKHIKVDRHPIPKAHEMCAQMRDPPVKLKFNFKQAYYQIVSSDKARELLTIKTHYGLFQYIRVPFGP